MYSKETSTDTPPPQVESAQNVDVVGKEFGLDVIEEELDAWVEQPNEAKE